MTTDQTPPAGSVPAVPREWPWPFSYYGVEFSPIGDDGDHLVAKGHPDLRRVLAAFNRYARVDVGLLNLADDSRADAEAVASVAEELKRTWAVQRMTCSDECDEGEDCTACAQVRNDGGWIFWGRNETEQGAFPVTVLMWV